MPVVENRTRYERTARQIWVSGGVLFLTMIANMLLVMIGGPVLLCAFIAFMGAVLLWMLVDMHRTNVSRLRIDLTYGIAEARKQA